MGKSIVDVGPFNGTVLFCFSMIGTSEAMSLDLGLDKNILAKLINSSTGQCWSSQSYNPCPGIVSNVASKESQTIIPLTEQTTKIYRKICSNGLNRKDFSVVYKYLYNLKN